MGNCPFCEERPFEKREFYRRGDWYAALDNRPMAKGHVLLVRKKFGTKCPDGLTCQTLKGLDLAVGEIVPLIEKQFGVRNVLIASLRGKHPHVHWHLVPQDEVLLNEWKQTSGWEEGHLFEFLAWLEQAKPRDALALSDLQNDVEGLRELARYGLP